MLLCCVAPCLPCWLTRAGALLFCFQGNPILICNQDDQETRGFAYKSLGIPHTEDCLQGILTIIPLQLLSMHIAELRKCDVSTAGDNTVPPRGVVHFRQQLLPLPLDLGSTSC